MSNGVCRRQYGTEFELQARLLYENVGKAKWPWSLVANEQAVTTTVTLILRVTIFALSLILFRATGKAFLATSLAFSGNLQMKDFVRLELWMSIYLALAIAGIFLAFSSSFSRRKLVFSLSMIGLLAAFTHRLSVNCTGPINQLDTFNFLGCVGGYGLSWIAAGTALCILILTFVNPCKPGRAET